MRARRNSSAPEKTILRPHVLEDGGRSDAEPETMRVLRKERRVGGSIVFLFVCLSAVQGQELRRGVQAGREVSALPLPVSGYEVYLVGELHGVKENEEILVEYLARLYAESGLRDVAIEEDAVYQRDAQAYVEGRSSVLPPPLCLRVGVLQALRSFNEGRKDGDLVRVHLVDIDSPAAAIRQHLLAIKEQVPAAALVHVPSETELKERGPETVTALKRLAGDRQALNELRTIEHSIGAYQQGLEVGTTHKFKGSPYLDDREQAIASNILDLVHGRSGRAVLALYGTDHVSRSRRKDGGAERNREFSPLALRLIDAGAKVFSLMTVPLSGHWSWRGREGEMVWSSKDGQLADGESLDQVLAAAPDAKWFYVDRARQRLALPSQDMTAFDVDAYLLFAGAIPMDDHCATQ